MVIEVTEKVKELHKKLTECFDTVSLGVAGRVVYYDSERGMFILAMHTTSPDKTQEASERAWENIPEWLKIELGEAGIGFAGRQI